MFCDWARDTVVRNNENRAINIFGKRKLFDIKPNSNAIPRTDHSTIADKDAGPLQLTAKKLPFPADVIEKFFEV